jgi:hypothetical protein
MAAKVETGEMIMVVAMKAVLLVAPSNILPRVWTAHPHIAYGLGLVIGIGLQNFIRPRLKPWQLYLLVALAIAGAFIAAKL